MKTRISRPAGFTLLEIMIVVAIIGLFTAIAVPNMVQARTPAKRNVCINNLRQINNAVQEWALEQNAALNATPVYDDIKPFLKSSVVCPSGGTSFSDSYTINGVTNRPTCQKLPATHLLTPDITN